MSSAAGLTLTELATHLGEFRPVLTGDGTIRVSDVSQDSRSVRPGTLFVARQGQNTDGARFVTDAEHNGAAALLLEESVQTPSALPSLTVRELPRAFALASEAVHHFPSQALELVGITGTNGKTTTAHLVYECLKQLQLRSAKLGTLGYEDPDGTVGSALTTPQADTLSRLLARARDTGCGHAVMEVSSHALALQRVSALRFAVGAFSNLTQDHLDFHRTLQAYGEAKAQLFFQLSPGQAVINVDDAFGRQLAERFARARPESLITVSARGESSSLGGRHLRVVGCAQSAKGTRLRVACSADVVILETELVGAHNVDNWLLCLGILTALGVNLAQLQRFAGRIPSAPGRLERCDLDSDDIAVLVDYAHTPDALARALQATRSMTTGKLWCVMGCGGDRDPDKRSLMGRAAREFADYSIVTSDNPRSEDPETIALAIEAGLSTPSGPRVYERCLDRRAAIRRAVLSAAPGDTVLIAGKGHEAYQIVGSEHRPFDDRVEARAALAHRREGAIPEGHG
ncbi:MAG: hypothetical protein RJA70_2113 [Pseudomonadota bacterium]|jgi:UDP-N-acetylmuramoyl-L-alanyl-D-glutamate--2,6-diaminopimelate ligase